MRFFSGHYHIQDEAVFFESKRCIGAHPDSFTNLGYGWAKSDRQVYHCGTVCRGIEADSIALLNAIYVRDSRGIHHCMKTLPTQAAEFRVLDPGFYSSSANWGSDLREGGYARDNSKVWWHHRALRGADPATFQSLRSGYGIDAHSVYHEEKRIAGADPTTFVAYTDRFTMDRNHVYFAGFVVPDVSPDHVAKMLISGVVYDLEKDLFVHGKKPASKEDYLKALDLEIAHLANMKNLIAQKDHHRSWHGVTLRTGARFVPLSP